MFDRKHPQLWPDLSRFISSVNQYGGRTWDLSEICLAYYRFNEYEGSEDISFKDRSGKQESVLLVSGSGNGTTQPGLPVVLTYDSNITPTSVPASWLSPLDYNKAPVSAELVPGSNKRLLRPFVRKCFDFSNRDVRFLLQKNLKNISAADDGGCTFVTRVCVSSAPSDPEQIFSISEFNKYQVQLSVQDNGGTYIASANLSTTPSATPGVTVAGLEYGVWYTVIFSAKYPGSLKLTVQSLEDGEQIGTSSTSAADPIQALTNPMLFVGYGDAGGAPNSTFPILGDDAWGKTSKIAELAIFRGELASNLIQAIATGWSDVDNVATHSMLFTNFKSGINSPSLKVMQRMSSDALRTYPSIARSGDNKRVGTGKVTPFHDEYTLIFSSSAKIRFPDMLPESMYSNDMIGHITRGDGEVPSAHGGPGDPSFFVSGSWITAPGRTAPGLKDDHQFRFSRHDRVVYGNNSNPEFSLTSPIAPFDDGARPSSVEIIHQPATPLDTLLGFDQNLGDRIAIVIDLKTLTDTPMGHEVGVLKLTGSIGAGGLDERTTVPVDLNLNSAISSIAYFNFDRQTWDVAGKIELPSLIDSTKFNFSSSIAFAGTTGFVISPDEEDTLLPLASRGRPTDLYGFPFDDRWRAGPGQTLDMSKYISSPMLLEKMLIVQDMEFQESGDDGLGYIMRDPAKSPWNFLPLSSSRDGNLRTKFETPPARARVDRFRPDEGGDWYRKREASYDAGAPTTDFMSYGRFPLMGGMRGQGTGFPRGTLIASGDGYKVVSNVAGDADTSLFSNSVTEEISIEFGQTPGGAAFWRCDTFFLMRSTKGKINQSVLISPPFATLYAPGGRFWPAGIDVGQTQAAIGQEFPIIVGDSFIAFNKAESEVRELITYSQIAHCGYVRSDNESQAHKSGSVWQEVHPLRAGAQCYPQFNEHGDQNKAWAGCTNQDAGFPRSGRIGPGGQPTGMIPWVNLGFADGWNQLEETRLIGMDVIPGSPGAQAVWPSPHPNYTSSFPTPGFEQIWRNAAWPLNATYNVLGVSDTRVNDPFETDPAKEWVKYQAAVNGSYARPFNGHWYSGSHETGGGSLISNPVYFVPESHVMNPMNFLNAAGEIDDGANAHGAMDFYRWGGFNTPGVETKQTLLDAGLRRDLTIQLTDGDRFIKLYAADPTPGSLGWCDIHTQDWPDAKVRDNYPHGKTISNEWTSLRPTSAYLVATASRVWPGSGDVAPLGPLRVLSSGTFTILSDIKNSARLGVQTGISWTSTYPQTGDEMLDTYNYTGPANWGTLGGMYEEVFIDNKVVLPITPACTVASTYNFSFPRGGRFIHTIKELSPINPSYRSLGMSSGRSFIRGVTAAIETEQKLSFIPPSKDTKLPLNVQCPGGKYGWTGPVGAAHFVQTKDYTPFIDWITASEKGGGVGTVPEQNPDKSQYHVFIGQLLPYSLGYDTRAWITYFPDMGIMHKYFGGTDLDGASPTIPTNWTGGGVTNIPGSGGTFPWAQLGGAAATPSVLSGHPPFTTSVIEKSKKSLAKEYVYSSPYILFPEDKLILGFQPAIGGGNPGAPKPINTPSLPFSTCDSGGWQGVKWNDYYHGISLSGWQDNGGFFQVPRSTCGTSGLPVSANPPTNPWPMFTAVGVTGEQSTYTDRAIRFSGKQNKSILSEQIRRTILKAGSGKLVLYGTLLRDNKPLPSELNQPLVTDAVHEALHYDNPVQDQHLVAQAGEYAGSYLTQYVTGSLLLNAATARVAATESAGNLGIDAAFNRFITIADEGEIFWDSVLPNPEGIWTADDKLIEDTAFYANTDRAFLWMTDAYTSGVIKPQPEYVNQLWARAFPFEARYANVERSLQDPADPDSRQSDGLTYPNPGYPDVKLSWPRASNGKYLAAFVPYIAPPPEVGIYEPGNAVVSSVFVYQSNTSADKATAAHLYGFARVGGVYGIPWGPFGGSAANVSAYPPPRKTLNIKDAGVTPSYYFQYDHPEGVKYGLKNYVWEPTKMSFRPDHYGQFRDTLEQRRYTKFFHRGNIEIDRGEQDSAVSCIFLDSSGNPVDDPSTTSCQNISTFMTSSIPYFEGTTLRTPPPPSFVSVNILTPSIFTQGQS